MTDIIIFEDNYYVRLLPLLYTRHIGDITIGGFTNKERVVLACKLLSNFDEYNIWAIGRTYLYDYIINDLKINYLDSECNLDFSTNIVIGVNGALALCISELKHFIEQLINSNDIIIVDSKVKRILGFKLKTKLLNEFFHECINDGVINNMRLIEVSNKYGVKVKHEKIRHIYNPWDLINIIPSILDKEINTYYKLHRDEYKKINEFVYVHVDATIGNHLYIKGSSPILIMKNVIVEDFVKLVGPLLIKEDVQIFSGARLSAGVLGRVTKFGAEMNFSIIDDFSNMAHNGYVGHSYIGRWVNIGALTVFSDLKNTYGNVKMNVNGILTDTGTLKLGSIVSDFTKISIGSQIYGGKWIGVSAFIHNTVPFDVPSFTVWTGKQLIELEIQKAFEVQKRMFRRRNIIQKEYHRKLLMKVFELTHKDRENVNVIRKNINFTNFI